MGTRNMASFSVTPMLIEEALKMPSGHEIVGAEWDFASRTIRLIVEGPDLPIVRQGEMVQNISPSLTRAIGLGGNERLFWSWGLDR